MRDVMGLSSAKYAAAAVAVIGFTAVALLNLQPAVATTGTSVASAWVAGIEIKPGAPPVMIAASRINNHASGTVRVEKILGSRLQQERPAADGRRYDTYVLLIEGGTLSPVRAANSPQGPNSFSVQPDTSQKCKPTSSNYATCLHILGQSVTVEAWDTDAYTSSPRDVVADVEWTQNGSIWEEHIWEDDTGPGRYYDYSDDVPHNFPNKANLCNYWPGWAGGEPCTTVKK